MEHRHPAVRVRRRARAPPRALQSRPGPHQNPPHPGPGACPGRRGDLHLAGAGPARRARHRPAASRRPAPLPPARQSRRVDRNRRLRHLAQPQIHRAHGVRPHPQPPRRPDRRTSPKTSGYGHPNRPTPRSSPAPLWDAAQAIGTEHSTSRDGTAANTHRQTRRTYVLRSRVRCRSCKRRMSGITRTATRYWADGPDYSNTYYTCSHDPDDPRHTAPDGHPRTISVREDHLLRRHPPVLRPARVRTRPRRPARRRPARHGRRRRRPPRPPGRRPDQAATPDRRRRKRPRPRNRIPRPPRRPARAPPSPRCARACWPGSPNSKTNAPRSTPS